MQKLLHRFSSQKRLNSIAQETRQVTLRFPLSTAAKADITVHAATNGDTTLASSDGAWPLGDGPGTREFGRIAGRIPQACQFSAERLSEPLTFRFGQGVPRLCDCVEFLQYRMRQRLVR